MKNVFITLAALLSLTTANAMYADQMTVTMSCKPTMLRMDTGMLVEVVQGGFAGITQINVKRFLLGHSFSETYAVKQIAHDVRRMGSGIEFLGENIQLTANFTTAPQRDGGHYGQLLITDENRVIEMTNLSCRILNRTF